MINIDLEKDDRLTEEAKRLMSDYYMRPEETSPQEAFARAASSYGSRPELAQRVYEYASKGWFMFASPILSNAGGRGLPISCFLTDVADTVDGLLDHYTETARLSVAGGGVGGNWSNVRAVDSRSPGPIPFIANINSAMTSWKQGSTRKGAYAAYLDVNHPTIQEFIGIRIPTGGDVNRKCFNLHNAVNLTDAFMEQVIAGEDTDLVCPHTGEVKEVVSAKKLFESILEARYRTGEPYLNYIDEANRKLHPKLRELGLVIKGSNLCNEIHLPTSPERTAVCCLSSVNLEFYSEWCNTEMVADLIEFLDDVLSYFIANAPSSLAKAVYSAERERSIGLGAMGWHSYLQRNLIPFEGPLAISATRKIFSDIKSKALAASKDLAVKRGEPVDLLGSGVRNAHLLAIAPNANSSTICGCSASIEPNYSNSFTRRSRVGTFVVENPQLRKLLEDKGVPNVNEEMKKVAENDGSVGILDCLTTWEKDVFKTFKEINMHYVIEHASHRQEFLCQGQSVNLFFPAGADRGYVKDVHIQAWKKKLKGLYYLRTESGAKTDGITKAQERVSLSSILKNDECLACQG